MAAVPAAWILALQFWPPAPLAAGLVYSDPSVPAPGRLAAGPVYDDDADRINAVTVKLPKFWQSKV